MGSGERGGEGGSVEKEGARVKLDLPQVSLIFSQALWVKNLQKMNILWLVVL